MYTYATNTNHKLHNINELEISFLASEIWMDADVADALLSFKHLHQVVFN